MVCFLSFLFGGVVNGAKLRRFFINMHIEVVVPVRPTSDFLRLSEVHTASPSVSVV